MASFGGGRQGQGQGPSDDGGVPAKPLINDGRRLVEPPTLTPAQLEWIREMYIKTLITPPRVNGFYPGPFPGPGVVMPDEYERAGAARAAKRVRHSESSGENKQEEAKTTGPAAAAAAPKK